MAVLRSGLASGALMGRLFYLQQAPQSLVRRVIIGAFLGLVTVIVLGPGEGALAVVEELFIFAVASGMIVVGGYLMNKGWERRHGQLLSWHHDDAPHIT